jgi:hypothetical protein
MTTRRRLLWSGVAVVLLLVVLRFVIRWADATGLLPATGGLVVAAVTVLVLAAVVTCAVLVVWRGQTRKNR